MAKQSNAPRDYATVRVRADLLPLVEKMEAFFEEVGRMPSGGDLEGLIEAHLSGQNRRFCELTLERREQAVADNASAQPEAFSPSGLSGLPAAAAPREPQTADDPDAPRRSALPADGL